jgi:hypothetical protein
MQSTSEAHAPRHAVAPQTYGSQALTVGAAQLPAPSQNAALVEVPALHDATPQLVFVEACAQVWFAAHAPVLPQTVPPVGHKLCGSALPVPTKVHVPLLPARLQAWQSGQLAAVTLQQTPSTQRPAAHWLSAVQASPMPPSLWQAPLALQKLPVAQSVPVVQLVLHPAVVHAYVPQLVGA